MNVIIIIVKKKSPHGNIPQGVCQTTKKKQENDAAKETSCSYVTKKKDTHTRQGFLCMFS